MLESLADTKEGRDRSIGKRLRSVDEGVVEVELIEGRWIAKLELRRKCVPKLELGNEVLKARG